MILWPLALSTGLSLAIAVVHISSMTRRHLEGAATWGGDASTGTGTSQPGGLDCRRSNDDDPHLLSRDSSGQRRRHHGPARPGRGRESAVWPTPPRGPGPAALHYGRYPAASPQYATRLALLESIARPRIRCHPHDQGAPGLCAPP